MGYLVDQMCGIVDDGHCEQITVVYCIWIRTGTISYRNKVTDKFRMKLSWIEMIPLVSSLACR